MYDGWFTIASTSPVFGSSTTAVPERARRVRDRGLELAVREVLQTQVDARAQVAPGPRFRDQLDVADHAPETVLQHALAAVLAPEPLVELGLEPFLAAIVDVGEAEQVPDDFACRVVALVFADRADARAGRAP